MYKQTRSVGSILNQQRSDEKMELDEREVKTGERVGGRGNREGWSQNKSWPGGDKVQRGEQMGKTEGFGKKEVAEKRPAGSK